MDDRMNYFGLKTRLGLLFLIPLLFFFSKGPSTYAAPTKTLPASLSKAWPSNTSIILKLDGTDRYFFPVTTRIDGLTRDTIAKLLDQGEFAVIQERLKSQPDQLKRFRSCMEYETSSAGRSNVSKKSYSLEVLATLCLASKSKTIDSRGYIHVAKAGQTPETLLISSNDPNYNSTLDIGIPTLNAKKDKSGKYIEDAKRTLPDFCGGAFADPKACMKVCEHNSDAPICRGCSQFDSGKTRFVNLTFKRSDALQLLRTKFEEIYGKKPGQNVAIAQAFLDADILDTARKQTGFDISQLRMYNTELAKDETIVSTCFPCPEDAKIDKSGKCMKGACDIGMMVSIGSRCKSVKDCLEDEVLVDGTCERSCASDCDRQQQRAESDLRDLDRAAADISNQRYSYVPSSGEVVKRFGLSAVIQHFQNARRTVLEKKAELASQRKSCGAMSAEPKCSYHGISSEDVLTRLTDEEKCGRGRVFTHGRCADSSCLICEDYANYYGLLSKPSLGECKEPELQLALRLLQERYRKSFDLLIEQCAHNPQVAQQCDALRNPSDQEIANLLKGYGVICFPENGSSSQNVQE